MNEKQQKPVTLLTVTGLFAAIITLMTAYICHIPYGANGGYIHFGDALIYVAAVILPRPYAMAAAAIERRTCRPSDCTNVGAGNDYNQDADHITIYKQKRAHAERT